MYQPMNHLSTFPVPYHDAALCRTEKQALSTSGEHGTKIIGYIGLRVGLFESINLLDLAFLVVLRDVNQVATAASLGCQCMASP